MHTLWVIISLALVAVIALVLVRAFRNQPTVDSPTFAHQPTRDEPVVYEANTVATMSGTTVGTLGSDWPHKVIVNDSPFTVVPAFEEVVKSAVKAALAEHHAEEEKAKIALAEAHNKMVADFWTDKLSTEAPIGRVTSLTIDPAASTPDTIKFLSNISTQV